MQNRDLFKCLSCAAVVIALIGLPAATLAQSASPASPSSNPRNAQPLNDLMAAAQRLRDATHDLVRERTSAERNHAIQKIDRTLAEVQNAIVSLPTNLLLADVTPSQKATDDLARAADRLHDAVASLNKTGNSGPSQDAISEIKKALASVHQERVNLQGKEGTANNAGSQPAGQVSTSTSSQDLPGELKQQMERAGYTEIKILPGSYLVSAKDKGGKDVMMQIGPNSMTVITEGDSRRPNGAPTGLNSQAK